jgi:hypothetical protein
MVPEVAKDDLRSSECGGGDGLGEACVNEVAVADFQRPFSES